MPPYAAGHIDIVTGRIDGVPTMPPAMRDPDGFIDGNEEVGGLLRGEFELGRSLALAFIDEHLPRSRETVREYLHGRGAYRRFKALNEWCAENGFIVSRSVDGG